jgi:hypothetical protein
MNQIMAELSGITAGGVSSEGGLDGICKLEAAPVPITKAVPATMGAFSVAPSFRAASMAACSSLSLAAACAAAFAACAASSTDCIHHIHYLYLH